MMWIVLTVVLVLLFPVLLVMGIKTKKVNLVIAAVASIVLAGVTGAVVVYKMALFTVETVEHVTKHETGEEVFASVFGRPGRCVQMIAYDEPAVMMEGAERTMCFVTCPAEVSGMLSQHPYDIAMRKRSEVAEGAGACCQEFFSKERFGEQVLECMGSWGAMSHTLYVSADSTRVVYKGVKN